MNSTLSSSPSLPAPVSQPIHLSQTDHRLLRRRLDLLTSTHKPLHAVRKLREELARAIILPPEDLPADVVRLDSTFSVSDLKTGEIDTFTLVLPEQADVDQGRLSLFSPLGVAVLGYRTGDAFIWQMPAGPRHMRLHAVSPP